MMNTNGLTLVTCLADKLNIRNGINNNILDLLSKEFGEIHGITRPNFSLSLPDQYKRESGQNLGAITVVFSTPREINFIPRAKAYLTDIENSYSSHGKRLYNLNPGILINGTLAMASHKWRKRRQQISETTWIEPQLSFFDDLIGYFPWSFPELLERNTICMLTEALTKSKKLTKQTIPNSPQPLHHRNQYNKKLGLSGHPPMVQASRGIFHTHDDLERHPQR